MDTTRFYKRQCGMALITSLILLSVLTTISLSIINSINMEEKIAMSYRKSLDVKNIAESGINEAINALVSTGGGVNNGFTDELDGTSPISFPVTDTIFDGGNYQVEIKNNILTDTNPLIDTDDTVYLVSTANKGNSKSVVTVLVHTPNFLDVNTVSWKEIN